MRRSDFVGKIHRPFTLKKTNSGTSVLNIEIQELEKKGETWEEHIFRITVWGKAAERIARQAKVGSEIVAFCKPESREYRDPSGRTKRSEDNVASWIRVVLPEDEGEMDSIK